MTHAITRPAPDLGSITVSHFEADGRMLRFATPRTFQPVAACGGELLTMQDDEINIDLVADTRRALDDMLTEELEALWLDYAVADASELTEKAADLGRTLRRLIQPAL